KPSDKSGDNGQQAGDKGEKKPGDKGQQDAKQSDAKGEQKGQPGQTPGGGETGTGSPTKASPSDVVPPTPGNAQFHDKAGNLQLPRPTGSHRRSEQECRRQDRRQGAAAA